MTVISAWSAVSPYGPDTVDFAAGVRDRRASPAGTVAGPGGQARTVPGFDIREALGRQGTRSMDRATALAVAATGQLLRDQADVAGDDTGLVMGTNTASAQSIMDFTRDSLTQARPYFVDPARFPNTVLNCAAAQGAIWHGLRGPNATVAGGRVTGLLALTYAGRLHRSGRATAVLCGAVEEWSTARAWLNHHAHPGGPTLGEGCAMVLLEPAGGAARGELAEVLAVTAAVYGAPGDAEEVLAGCLRRALAAAGTTAEDVWMTACAGGPEPSATAELAAVTAAVGAPVVPIADLIGDTDAAAASFGVAALLALAAGDGAAAGRVGLVTAVDPDGRVGCAVLRMTGAGAG